MTAEERTRIQEAGRRYVREQAPRPPVAVLERVARIVLEARRPNISGMITDPVTLSPGQLGAA
jgi:hypothetical protein